MPWCLERPSFLPPDLILEPISRRPTVLPETTVRTVPDLPAGAATGHRTLDAEPFDPAARTSIPRVSIVVITRDNLVFSKLCLESVLANTDYPDYELIVVDNGSGDELLSYLDQLDGSLPVPPGGAQRDQPGVRGGEQPGARAGDGRPIRPPQ